MTADPWQSSVDAGGLVCDGHDGEKAKIDASWNTLNVDPKRHPRHDHREDARRKHLDDVVADVPLYHEPDLGARVRPCTQRET